MIAALIAGPNDSAALPDPSRRDHPVLRSTPSDSSYLKRRGAHTVARGAEGGLGALKKAEAHR